MKNYLEGVIARKSDELDMLKQKNKDATALEELRSIGPRIEEVMAELTAARAQLASMENAPEERGLDPMASYGMKKVDVRGEDEDVRSSMEYRKAFMDYCQGRGQSDILIRANSEQVSEDLGILLPNTIVNRIMLDIQQVYGQIYKKVRKTNVKGGIQFAKGSFSAKMYWDGQAGNDPEHGVTEYQRVGEVEPFISFSYHIAEMRIAQSLLQQILTVQAFEDEVVRAFLEAYVREMDMMVLIGNGVTQPEGILTHHASAANRIPERNIIEISEEEMLDWKTWQKKLFSKVPLAMRRLRPEFLMTAETFEANILTLVDDNNNPIARETYNASTGDEKATFKAREVTFIEEGPIKSFDSAESGDVFAIYWVPSEAYMINSQQQFSYKRWFDDETNQWKQKGLLVCDGKIFDANYIWLIKKA